jgi:hypothetical protein
VPVILNFKIIFGGGIFPSYIENGAMGTYGKDEG